MKNIKRVISVFLTLAIIISAVFINGFASFSSGNVWDGNIAPGFSKGTGAVDDPYIITTAEELAYLSEQVDYGSSYDGVYFELGADIILNDLTGNELWGTYDENNNIIAPVNEWIPIGRQSYYAFNGHFDGKGYTVYGVYVNGGYGEYFGLFGYVAESNYYGYGEKQTVKNVNVADSYIYGEKENSNADLYVGGVVGYGNAEGCSFDGRVCVKEDEYSYVGGIVGYGDARYCVNYGTVTGEEVGGIVCVGKAYYCDNYGDIYAYGSAGGIVRRGYAIYCSNSGDIYADNADTIGGIAADAYSYSVDEVTQYCFNRGNINVLEAYYDTIGGVVGYGIVLDCYNSGNITLSLSDSDNDVGGIVGNLEVSFDTALSGCYNSGTISVDCSGDIGAVVGENSDEVAVEDCYYLESAYANDNYATALTEEEMKSSDSFENWNFNRLWEYATGAEYPYPTLRYFGSKKYYYSAGFYTGDGTLIKEVLAEENEEITFTEPTGIVGKKFCYWENEGTKYYSGDTLAVTEDMAFYAVLEKNNTSSKTWDGSIADSFSGSGTEEDPYLITSAAELAYLAQSVNAGNKYSGKYFSLTDDIYLNDISDEYSYFTMAENNWKPIGNSYDNYFNGHFDGNGHTVYGFYLKSSDRYVGLFGYSYKGKIKNLNVEDSALFCYFEKDDIDDSKTIYAGLAVGYSYGEVENCTVSGTAQLIINRYEQDNNYHSLYLGGVVGYCEKLISNCVNNAALSFTSTVGSIGTLNGTFRIGGIAGRCSNTVQSCVNNGAVSAFDITSYYSYLDVYLSGVTGSVENITDCVNNGKISAEEFLLSNYESDRISVSGVSSDVDGEAKNCVNNAEISGFGSAGGVFLNDENDSVIDGCINNGTVKGSSVGGIIVASCGILRNCENTGNLSQVESYNHNGHIGGIASSGETAYRCVNRGKITVKGTFRNGWHIMGGIFGSLSGGSNAGAVNTISECVSYGEISFESEIERLDDTIIIGGIVGEANNNHSLVEKCFFDGNIAVNGIADGDVGGIAGRGVVKNCLYEGSISVFCDYLSGDLWVGGIIGSGTAENSLSLGDVELECTEDYTDYHYDILAGGIAGDQEAAVTNSFYLNTPNTLEAYKNTSGTKGSSQTLSNKATFNGWDFNKVWEMRGTIISSYPTLRFIGSKNYMYYLEFVDEGKTISKQLLSGGSNIDFSVPYEKEGYTFAYWEKDGIYYYPDDSHILDGDGTYTAVWVYKNKEAVWNGELIDTQWQGSGTEDDPYLITSAEELAGLAKRINETYNNNYEGVFFKQTNDIFLNDAYDYSHTVMAENVWTPIGRSSSYSFMGNYDGNGYAVHGIYIKSNGYYDGKIQYGGLFGHVRNVTVKNLTVDNSYLEHFGGTNYYAEYGAFAGRVYHDGFIKIENCINKADVHTDYRSGGFVGYVNGNVIINNCSNYGKVSGITAGGFVGYVSNSMDDTEIAVRDSVNYGDVCDLEFVGSYTGGFIGNIYNYFTTMDDTSEFVNLENKGEITCKHGYAGGIAGYVECIYTVENCVNSGEITAVTGGGIFASVSRYSSIKNCTNNASMYGENIAGGIVAVCPGSSNGSVYISECENNADVKSGSYSGGITASGIAYVYDSTNNGNITGGYYTGGISAEAIGRIWGCENYGNIFATTHGGGIAGGGASYVQDCANFGEVNATGSYAGGIVGYWPWSSYATIKDCYNTGNINGTRNVGGILGYDNSQGYGSLSGCYNTGFIFGVDSIGGIVGDGDAVNCYNIGGVTGGGNIGGIVGNGTANYSYNTGDITGTNGDVGGIVGNGNAGNCYNTGTVNGYNHVGGIVGDGSVSTCYNIGDVYGEYYVGTILGEDSPSPVNCYYLDSVVISSEGDRRLYYNGIAVDSITLAAGTLEGFDFTEVWEVGVATDYDYPTLKNTTHAVTYTVTFLDADGVTVLKEQKVRDGFSASPPVIEPYTDADHVYALDHWEGDYRNVTSDITVKAVYKKTDKIRFIGTDHSISVPFGFSADNFKVTVESAYSRLLCETTNGYQMKCEAVWDFSDYNPHASGTYTLTGTLIITESPYYEMAEGERITLTVTVLEGDDNLFDQSHLTYTLGEDGTATVTGYTGSAEEIRIPERLDGYSVSAIADGAFKDNENVISVYIPSSVKIVGANAFKGCASLVQVTFCEGLESVGEYAFADTAMTNVTLPASLEAIGEKAFGCYDENSFVDGFTVYAFGETASCDYANENRLTLVTVESKTDSGTGIIVIAEEGVELSVSKVVGGDYFDTANTIAEKANISLFEIKIFDETNDELQPGNMMTISVPVPAGFNENSRVYRINADGSYMDMNAQLVDGMLVFNTAHLSYYAIISEDDLLLGDVNGDGSIDTTDLATLKLSLAGIDIETGKGADMNADGNVDTTDLASLKLYLSQN